MVLWPSVTVYMYSPTAWSEQTVRGHIYRTGDLPTAGPNGYIQVVDRKKDMLLVGGENVYSE